MNMPSSQQTEKADRGVMETGDSWMWGTSFFHERLCLPSWKVQFISSIHYSLGVSYSESRDQRNRVAPPGLDEYHLISPCLKEFYHALPPFGYFAVRLR